MYSKPNPGNKTGSESKCLIAAFRPPLWSPTMIPESNSSGYPTKKNGNPSHFLNPTPGSDCSNAGKALMLVSLTVAIVLLQGCSALASKEASVGCQTADAVSTFVAIKGGAVEANPIVAGVIDSFGWGGFFLLKAGIAYLLVQYHDSMPQGVRAGINGVTCGAAINNVAVAR